MSEETLHSAARRALREFRIIEGHGLVGVPLQQAMAVLSMQVDKENARVKERAKQDTDAS